MIYKPTQGLISAGGFRNHPRYRGCVGHWMMDSGGGLVAYDISSYKVNGTLSGGPTWVGNQFGPSLSFDGTDDIVAVDSVNSALNGSISWAISFWASSTVNTADHQVFSISWSSSSNDLLTLYPYETLGGGLFNMRGLYSGTSFQESGNTTSRADGKLHHIVFNQISATSWSVYFDGQTVLTNTTSKTLATSLRLGIGGWYRDPGTYAQFFAGRIDEVRLYSRGLSVQDIQSLYTDPFLEFAKYDRKVYAAVAAATYRSRIININQAPQRAAYW